MIDRWIIPLYFTPLMMCLICYSIRTIQNYLKDLKNRTAYEKQIVDQDLTGLFLPHDHPKYIAFYSPTDSIGSILGRILVSICPILNFWALIFDIGPQLFPVIMEKIESVLNQPLVPERKL